jgi:hypothetical protein
MSKVMTMYPNIELDFRLEYADFSSSVIFY